ncbi:hypothetical protein Fmac_021802 [Flemingia macrophylla]|uniref:Uncharacterized protein n=1 Tax=Flemingia macrophylla TaxID=520843 RepID=A0ABD1LXY3_9FABA
MLHLMVFPNDKTLNPYLQCHDLIVSLHSSHSFLAFTTSFISLRVPPLLAVLLDGDAPVTSRPLSDHIEIKLLLLFPVDHPVLFTIDDSAPPLPDPLVAQSGIREKMVMRYVSSYMCSSGMCLLSSTSLTLCKDDLVECDFHEGCGEQEWICVVENLGDDGVDIGIRNCELDDERTSTCCDDGVVGKVGGVQEM